ncbi:hypothetical protein HNQ57_002089 [Zhongshania antarctica]|jgi:hypothetical protein|uniref:Uncharacterized protein n=1 Tax=Zhongshania antarctica TaxID=641702 RepID=A0A840R617_9GAMM|nr:hypothetical protein [Zhongshania antarctica]
MTSTDDKPQSNTPFQQIDEQPTAVSLAAIAMTGG